jgi:hypothetical protein
MFLFLSSKCCTQSSVALSQVSRDSEDKLWWVSSKKDVFKVKSFYSLACSGSSSFPWKSVWRTQAPSRAAFFVWTVAIGKILTLDNFRKWHVIVINKCYMCKKTGESVDHFLLHCDVASALWSSLQSFRDVLGYAQTGYRLACLLVVLWKANDCCGLENSAYLLLLVLMEGKKQ